MLHGHLKKTASLFSVFLFSAWFSAHSTIPEIKRVVVIGVDGMGGFYLNQNKAKIPNLDALKTSGAWTYIHMRNTSPGISLPNWFSMAAGTEPAGCGVTTNTWHRPSGFNWPTMYGKLFESIPDFKTAVFAQWPVYLEVVESGTAVTETGGDESEIMDKAVRHFLESRPQLIFIHLNIVDVAGHTSGWGSSQYYAAIETADALIGRMVGAVRGSSMAGETAIVVTADHGGIGKNHNEGGGDPLVPENSAVPFIISGPGVRRTSLDRQIIGRELRIFDLAPTMLYVFGVCQPIQWTGLPVTEAFSKALSEPVDLTAKAAGQNRIDLAWTNTSRNHTGFRIERKTTGGSYKEIATVGSSQTVYTDAGLTGGFYTYRVRSTDGTGQSDCSNEASAAVGVLMRDDFSGAQLQGWSVVDQGKQEAPSAWKTDRGEAAQSSNLFDALASTAGRLGTYIYRNSPSAFSWSGYAVDVKVRSLDDDGIGIMFSYRDVNNYYRFEMDSQRKFRRLIRKVKGVVTLLASAQTGYTADRMYAIHAEASDGSIRVKVDGMDQFGGAVADDALPGGTVALYCWGNAGSYFDDLTVTAVTPELAVPAAPAALTASAGGSRIDLAWSSASRNHSGFKIERRPAGGPYAEIAATGSGQTSYSDALDLAAGAAYSYRVRAYNETGNSDYSNEASAVAGLLMRDDFSGARLQGWSAVDQGKMEGPSAWKTDRGEAVQSSNVYDALTSSADRVGTYVYWNATPALTWSNYSLDVKLRAADDDGIGIMFYYGDINNYYRFEMDSQRKFRRLIGKVKGVATLLASSQTGYTKNRTYSIHAEASGGTIRVKVDGDEQFGGAVADQALPGGTVALYCWGNAGSYFDDAVVTSLALSVPASAPISVLPSAPAGLTAKIATGAGIALTWTASSPVPAGYHIERKQQGGAYAEIGTAGQDQTAYSDASELASGTAYAYRVRAYNEAGNSEYSNEAAVTVPAAAEWLRDDFNDGNLAGWSTVDQGMTEGPSKWSSWNAAVLQSSNCYDNLSAVAGRLGTYACWNATSALTWSNYSLDVKLRAADDDGIGVMFYYRDPNNYYRFEMDSQRKFRRLIKKVNGVVTLLAGNQSGHVMNQTYAIRVEVYAGSIRVKVDGKEQFGGAVPDQALPGGSVALYCWGNAGSIFDDVVVTSLNTVLQKARENDFAQPGRAIPDLFAMAQNYPNPFNPSTVIDYSLPEAGDVRIQIYDDLGREIRTLVNEAGKPPGFYTAIWNGKNRHGMNVPTGMYLCRIMFRGQAVTRKMTLVK